MKSNSKPQKAVTVFRSGEEWHVPAIVMGRTSSLVGSSLVLCFLKSVGGVTHSQRHSRCLGPTPHAACCSKKQVCWLLTFDLLTESDLVDFLCKRSKQEILSTWTLEGVWAWLWGLMTKWSRRANSTVRSHVWGLCCASTSGQRS